MTISPGLLVSLTLFVIMVALGVNLQPIALRQLQHRWPLVLRIVLGSCLLVPLLAVALLQLPLADGIGPEGRFSIALMALCPSAPLILRKAGKAGGDPQLAALLQVVAALAAIVSVPTMAEVMRAQYALAGWQILPGDIASQVLRAQVAPLMLGLGLRTWAPRLAARLKGPLDTLGNGLLLALVAVLLAKALPKIMPFLVGNLTTLVAMVVLALICLTLGALLADGEAEQRRTGALVMAMRNPGLALLLATTHGAEMPMIRIGVLAYVLVTAVVIIGTRFVPESVKSFRWSRPL